MIEEFLVKRAKKKSREGVDKRQGSLSQRGACKLNGNRAYGAFIFSGARHAARTTRAARREGEKKRRPDEARGPH